MALFALAYAFYPPSSVVPAAEVTIGEELKDDSIDYVTYTDSYDTVPFSHHIH